MSILTQKRYPNKLELDLVPGVQTWVIIATDGTTYASLAALKAAGKLPWPQSYTLSGTLVPGLEQNTGLGSLTAQADGGAAPGSAFYFDFNLATAPSTDNPAALLVSGASVTYDDIGTLWNVWVRMTSNSDKLRLTLRY